MEPSFNITGIFKSHPRNKIAIYISQEGVGELLILPRRVAAFIIILEANDKNRDATRQDFFHIYLQLQTINDMTDHYVP